MSALKHCNKCNRWYLEGWNFTGTIGHLLGMFWNLLTSGKDWAVSDDGRTVLALVWVVLAIVSVTIFGTMYSGAHTMGALGFMILTFLSGLQLRR